MSERRAAIIRLLESREWPHGGRWFPGLPDPPQSSTSSAGFIHALDENRETCPDCFGERPDVIGCETCRGAGTVRAPRKRDPYSESAVVMPFGFDGNVHDLRRERDRQERIMALQTRPAPSEADLLAEANAHPSAWELVRTRMYRLFDYAALDRALEQLRNLHDQAYRALHAVYVYGWMEERAGPNVLLDVGLEFLDRRLPDPLRAPAPDAPLKVRGPLHAAAGVDAKALRDAEMRELAHAGADPAELAREFRVSIRTVYRVVNAAA